MVRVRVMPGLGLGVGVGVGLGLGVGVREGLYIYLQSSCIPSWLQKIKLGVAVTKFHDRSSVAQTISHLSFLCLEPSMFPTFFDLLVNISIV